LYFLPISGFSQTVALPNNDLDPKPFGQNLVLYKNYFAQKSSFSPKTFAQKRVLTKKYFCPKESIYSQTIFLMSTLPLGVTACLCTTSFCNVGDPTSEPPKKSPSVIKEEPTQRTTTGVDVIRPF
jgi:hypothetical protein